MHQYSRSREAALKKTRASSAARHRPVSYRQALDDLRASAEGEVQAGIDAARDTFAAHQRLVQRPPSRRKGRGMALEALYSGILDAVAVSIMETSEPGMEADLAQLVAGLLVSKVHAMSCDGRA